MGRSLLCLLSGTKLILAEMDSPSCAWSGNAPQKEEATYLSIVPDQQGNQIVQILPKGTSTVD